MADEERKHPSRGEYWNVMDLPHRVEALLDHGTTGNDRDSFAAIREALIEIAEAVEGVQNRCEDCRERDSCG